MVTVKSSTSGPSESWLDKAQEGSSNIAAEGGTGAATRAGFEPTAGLSFKPAGTPFSAPTKTGSAPKQQIPAQASAPAPKQKAAPDQLPPLVKQALDAAVEAQRAYEKAEGDDEQAKAKEKMAEANDNLKDAVKPIVKQCTTNDQCDFNSAQKATEKLERATLNDARKLKTDAAVTKERQEAVHEAINRILVDIACDSLINATAANKRSIIKQVASWIIKEKTDPSPLFTPFSPTNELFGKLQKHAVGTSKEKVNHLMRVLDTELDNQKKKLGINVDDVPGLWD